MKKFLVFLLLSGSIFTLMARQLQVAEPEFSGVILLIRNDQLGEALESDSDKNRRFITTGTVNFNKTTAADIDFIPFSASKYLESSYLLEIEPLPPGEYAVTLEGCRDVFNLFGVDPN